MTTSELNYSIARLACGPIGGSKRSWPRFFGGRRNRKRPRARYAFYPLVVVARIDKHACDLDLRLRNGAKSAYTEAVKFRVVLEYDPVALCYSAVCPELPGCTSAGETEPEARQNIEEAIRLYLAPSELDLPDNAKLVEVMVG